MTVQWTFETVPFYSLDNSGDAETPTSRQAGVQYDVNQEHTPMYSTTGFFPASGRILSRLNVDS